MERESLIKQCRYYKGEAENPFEGQENNDALFWFYEKRWVELTIQQDSYLQWMSDEYARRGLADFHTEIPIELRAILHNRYNHWTCGTDEDFKSWFEQDYLKHEAQHIEQKEMARRIIAETELIRERDKKMREAVCEIELAIKQHDYAKLDAMATIKEKRGEDCAIPEAFPFGGRLWPLECIAERIKWDYKKPEIFKRYPSIETEFIPKLLENKIISKVATYRYMWMESAALYGSFIKHMAEVFVGKKTGEATANSFDNFLVERKSRKTLGKIKQGGDLVNKDYETVLSYTPYREVFINGKNLEGGAKKAISDYKEPDITKYI